MLVGLIAAPTGVVSTVGQVRQVSFEDAAAADGTDNVDSRDVTVIDDGHCFVYSSQNTAGLAGLQGGFSDWRTWKTCGVFDGETLTNTLMSNPAQPDGDDYTFPQASEDGQVLCYFNNSAADTALAADGTFKNLVDYPTPTTSSEKLGYRGCDVSRDGSTVTFPSEDGAGVYQVYSHDRASDVTTLISDAGTEKALWPRTSFDGSRTVFVSDHSGVDEAVLYDRSYGTTAQVTALEGPKQCNKTYMYELMVAEWGVDALNAENINAGTLGNGQTPCMYYAAKGVIDGAGAVDLGDNGADISGDGRFVVFGAGYDLATARGTYESKSTVATRNLFLFDAALGLTWQITAEGDESQLEAFCCPGASSSKQRGTCSLKNEMKGFCCWQRPCGHPTVTQHISTDGKSIVFSGDGYPDPNRTNMDYDVFHHYIPTSLTTSVTRTSNKDYDDFYVDISARGDVVAWTSDYNYETEESITKNNQIFASKLALGCSLNPQARNYLASPDVEVCCEFDDDSASAAGDVCEAVRLKFNGNADDMFARVPFTTSHPTASALAFCASFAEAVRDDVACSLAVSRSALEVATPTCASAQFWAAGGIEVVVSFTRATSAVNGVSASPSALAAQLVAQTQDSSSRLWSGYITKTMRTPGDAPAAVESCPASALGDPITQFGGKQVKYRLPSQVMAPVFTQGNATLAFRAGGAGDNWVVDVQLLLNGVPAARIATVDPRTLQPADVNLGAALAADVAPSANQIDISSAASAPSAAAAAGAASTRPAAAKRELAVGAAAEMLTSLRVWAGEEELRHAGEQRTVGGGASSALSAQLQTERLKEKLGTGFVDRVRVRVGADLAFDVYSSPARKFEDPAVQIANVHTDVRFVKWDQATAKGALPEMWGTTLMTPSTAAIIEEVMQV